VPFGPELYAGWRHSELGIRTERLEHDLILKLTGPVAGMRVLEVGCGDGLLAVELERRGALVVGIDASQSMLAGARHRDAELMLCQALAEQLPFADASYDLVVAVTILCFVEDADRTFRELSRVLRPGGRLVIGELGSWSTWAVGRRLRAWFGSALWRRGRFRTAGELKKLAGDSGLTPSDVAGAIYYPRWTWAARRFAPLDRWLGPRTTIGAAFLALVARKPVRHSP
jgi:SAM-dependent methyltransferase